MSSEYTVNAMDAEELRKSQRRLKNGSKSSSSNALLGRQLSSRSDNMPSQESDIDDEGMDETPTTPGADRSMTSVFSVR